jgi:deoxyribodipyrimidine photo-lyase
MKDEIAIHWFRQDLRLSDNPSLNYLSENNKRILGIYILDEINSTRKLGSASKIWLHHSLLNLNSQMKDKLLIFCGDPQEIFDELIDNYNIGEICWSRCYEPWRVKKDLSLKSKLKKKVKVNSFNSSLLWEPWEIVKADGSPYKIFTPFFRRGCLNYKLPRKPETGQPNFFKHTIKSLNISDLKLLSGSTWEKNIIKKWVVGESHALKMMEDFFTNSVHDYSIGRNFPNQKNVSRLSPYLHWGQISPNTLWYKADMLKDKVIGDNVDVFKSELGWREFSYNLMYHFPKIQKSNLQKKFDNFPWEDNKNFLEAWRNGITGYPIVDAGMRELWQTGYMHNRVRMISGSFLVKNLLIHWNRGEEWFWDCLFDADYASNSASWQWVAGTGTDSAPYFRIFNPVTQAKKFDPSGEYIRKYVPELKHLPLKYLYEPWECPENIVNNFKLGKNYPSPIIDIKISREKALNAFSSLKAI